MLTAVIADDLTGAADTGVQLVRAGYRTAVSFRGSRVPPDGDLDAAVFDTDSRTLPAGPAAKRVVEAGRAARGARVVYKKLDSTLRGPVAAELSAALAASRRGRVVVAPAFPAAGRTTGGGVQLVDGEPVHETEFADDPRTPVREGHIPALLAGSFSSVGTLGVGELAEPGNVRRALEGSECVVADAEGEGDLEALVRAVPDPASVLWAGSAGLAQALGTVYPGPHAGEEPAEPDAARGVVVVVGSLSGVARGQLRRLAEEYGADVAVPVATGGFPVAAVEKARAALLGGGCAVVHSSGERRPRGVGGPVITTLARAVSALSEEDLFDALVMTGGSTAVGVSRTLGASGLRLRGEIEAGVPFGSLVGGRPYTVVTKAGGFGGPCTLVGAVRTLLGSGKG